MNEHIPETEFAERRRRLSEEMRARDIDALFIPPSDDLEYLTGLERDLPSFGQHGYAHGWVAGAFIVPDADPLFLLPRMIVALHLWDRGPANLVTVNEADDGSALFARAAQSLGKRRPARRGRAHVGRDHDRDRPRPARRRARERHAARQQAATRQVAARARADDGRLPHRGRDHGRDRARSCRPA